MNTDFERIEKAILFIQENFKSQPELDEVARHIYLSPFHFQKLFKNWAGVSPKKFLQFISIEHAKKLLQKNASLADATYETGLSGTGRLHDLFIQIEGMTPGEYKNGGSDLLLNYSYAETPFGDIMIASSAKGICHISFVEDNESSFSDLQKRFPNAQFRQKTDLMQQKALQVFKGDWRNLSEIKLHLKATPFQLKVWETLLKIPMGNMESYAHIAEKVQSPGASRAVGTAVAQNPVAFLIPCHRVIKSTGIIGEYHWGSLRKTAMLGWESSKIFGDN